MSEEYTAYQDLYLKFPNEETWYSLVENFTPTEGLNIDVIGVITKSIPTEETDDYDNPILTFETIPGFHVNIRHSGEYPEEFNEFIIEKPSNPVRVWF